MSDRKYTISGLPEVSDKWELVLSTGYVFRPRAGAEPNAFWRLMHFLMFGFKWQRVKK